MTLNGLPAVAIDGVGRSLFGATARGRVVLVMTPSRSYVISSQTIPADWTKDLPVFEAAIASFHAKAS